MREAANDLNEKNDRFLRVGGGVEGGEWRGRSGGWGVDLAGLTLPGSHIRTIQVQTSVKNKRTTGVVPLQN